MDESNFKSGLYEGAPRQAVKLTLIERVGISEDF